MTPWNSETVSAFFILSLSLSLYRRISRIIQRDSTLAVVSRTGRQRIPSLESGFYYPVTRCVKAASDLTISRDLISSPVSGEHVTRQAAFVDKNLLSSAPLPIRASFPTQARFQPRFRDENRPVGPVPGCRKAESILEIDIDPPSLRIGTNLGIESVTGRAIYASFLPTGLNIGKPIWYFRLISKQWFSSEHFLFFLLNNDSSYVWWTQIVRL